MSGDVSKPALEGGAARCACRFYYPGVGGQRGGANARFGVFAYGQKRGRLSRDEAADAVLFMLSRQAGVNVDEMVLTPLKQIV